jgi:hypothetical protein
MSRLSERNRRQIQSELPVPRFFPQLYCFRHLEMSWRNKGNNPVRLHENVLHFLVSGLKSWVARPNDTLRQRGNDVPLGGPSQFRG